MITIPDMLRQVVEAASGCDGEYDVDAITEEIHERYGLVDIDDIDADEFWEIVGKHATDDQDQ